MSDSVSDPVPPEVYEAQPTTTSDWVVLNTHADMIVASRLTEAHARRIAAQLNRGRQAERGRRV